LANVLKTLYKALKTVEVLHILDIRCLGISAGLNTKNSLNTNKIRRFSSKMALSEMGIYLLERAILGIPAGF